MLGLPLLSNWHYSPGYSVAMRSRRAVISTLWTLLCLLLLLSTAECDSDKENKRKISENGPSFMKRGDAFNEEPLRELMRFERIPYYLMRY